MSTLLTDNNNMTTIEEFKNAMELRGFKYKSSGIDSITGQCPAHQGNNLNMTAKQSGDKLLTHCFSKGCDFVDIIGSLGLKGNYEKTEMAEWEKDFINVVQESKAEKAIKSLNQHIEASQKNDFRIHEYLYGRGLKINTQLDDIGFIEQCYHYKHKCHYGAIFAVIRNMIGEAVGGHRTYIKDGDKISDNAKMKLGSAVPGITKGGAVRLMNNEDSDVLYLAEGIETALAVSQLVGTNDNFWSCLDAGGLANFDIPSRFEKIFIYADKDKSLTGQFAAESLAAKYYNCEIVYPDLDGFGDFLDMLCK